ncbi:heparin lyase I family protein [Colwellia echini]|nr:heparin lyase I family protein [Colwellia echini]
MRKYQPLRGPISFITILVLLFACTSSEQNKPNEKGWFALVNDANFLAEVSAALSASKLQPFMHLEAPLDNVDVGNDSVTFTLTPEQEKIFGGIRSELAVNFPYVVGDKITYRFDMLIPDDFLADKGKNRWWLFAQWHDQPNPQLGETWSGFPKNSPPIGLFLEEKDNQFGMTIHYLGNKKFWFPVNKGKWNRYAFNITWSNDSDGELIFSLNDDALKTFNGKNMLNNYQHYLKIGMYRNPNINSLNHVEFKELIIVNE